MSKIKIRQFGEAYWGKTAISLLNGVCFYENDNLTIKTHFDMFSHTD